VPYIFWNFEIQFCSSRTRSRSSIRTIRITGNSLEPAPSRQGDPSIHGDSVGHYEGDTLVVDTVGIKVGKYAMSIVSGRLIRKRCTWSSAPVIDYDAAKEAQTRAHKDGRDVPSYAPDPDYGQGIAARIHREDPRRLHDPWKATITICAPATRNGTSASVPRTSSTTMRTRSTNSDKERADSDGREPDF